jgi:phosphate transport system permease protein
VAGGSRLVRVSPIARDTASRNAPQVLPEDQEFDGAKTLSAFALGRVLFFATLALSVLALRSVRRYREEHE